jgi:hypothetical protein
MEHPGMERLRAHLQRHNRRVLWLTIATFLFAAALWFALYFVTFWLFLLGHTAVSPFDFQPASGPLVRGFAATAVVLCLFAWVARRMRPNEAARDHKSFVEHFVDVLLAVPRVTLAIFGMSTAAARLSDAELEHAWRLLVRLNDGTIPMQSLPVDIPDPSMRNRIVLALQLGDLIDIRPTSTGPVIAFRNEKARLLAQERVRLRF